MRGWFIALAVGGLLSAAVAVAAGGEELFQQNCSGCHQADARGIPGTFPPLVENPDLQDREYITRTIREGRSGPIEVQGQHYDGVMPPFANLTDEEVEALADYLQNTLNANSGAETPTVAPPTEEPPRLAGDAERGRKLFLGQARFERGGAHCLACHSAGQTAGLGGGNMGRGETSAQGDLTVAYRKYGEDGLLGVLGNPPFRVMRHLYRDRPFSEQEKADLVAFLASTSDTETVAAAVFGQRLWLFGGVGAIILFGLMSLGWGRQRQSFAERLRRKP